MPRDWFSVSFPQHRKRRRVHFTCTFCLWRRRCIKTFVWKNKKKIKKKSANKDVWTSATNEGAYSNFKHGWCGDGTLLNAEPHWLPWSKSRTHNCVIARLNASGVAFFEASPCNSSHRALVLCEYEPNFSRQQIPTRGPRLYPLLESLVDSDRWVWISGFPMAAPLSCVVIWSSRSTNIRNCRCKIS
jgi:hypothetical protein